MTTLQESYDRLYFLRHTVVPHMERNPDFVCWNKTKEEQVCGTSYCLFGWYRQLTGIKGIKLYFPNPILSETNQCMRHFDISLEDMIHIFGFECRGTLADRAARLDKLLAERAAKLGLNKPSGAEIVKQMIGNNFKQLEHA